MKINNRYLSRSFALGLTGSLLVGAWQAGAQTYSTSDNTRLPTATLRSVRVGNLTGTTVKDTLGQTIGQIQDLVADTTTGNINLAVISLNQAAEQKRFMAVPWNLLSQTDSKTFVLNATPEALRTAQTFSANNWPDFSRSDYAPQVYAHYGASWPQQTAMGGSVALPSGVERGTGPSYNDRRYYEGEKKWYRPQPDGRDTFPQLHEREGYMR